MPLKKRPKAMKDSCNTIRKMTGSFIPQFTITNQSASPLSFPHSAQLHYVSMYHTLEPSSEPKGTVEDYSVVGLSHTATAGVAVVVEVAAAGVGIAVVVVVGTLDERLYYSSKAVECSSVAVGSAEAQCRVKKEK